MNKKHKLKQQALPGTEEALGLKRSFTISISWKCNECLAKEAKEKYNNLVSRAKIASMIVENHYTT